MASKKKIFRVYVEVECVVGCQAFDVYADSEEEAKKVFEAKGGEFSHEDLEVQNLGEINRVEEVTDGTSALEADFLS